MHFRSFSKLMTIMLLALTVITISVTFGAVRQTAFASSSLLTGSQMPTILFNGIDTNGYAELWATTGTAKSTTKITSITVDHGLVPYDITAFGKQALFSGTDASGRGELWVTDGTVTGTKELTSATSTFGGIAPNYITVLGNQAVFTGEDGQLWVTDGTSTGNHPLMNIANVDRYGLNPSDITALGKQALFNGYDAKGNQELWVTDGTALGTKELTTISTNPRDITVFGNQAVFTGADGLDELWVTNGTLTGTTELSVPNADVGFSPNAFAPFGNQVLFAGFDTNGSRELWVTNGTGVGTKEITTTTNGFYSQLSPSGITTLGNKAVFQGYDGSGNRELWITDGTIGGTNELTNVPNTDSYDNYPFDITVFGTQAVFNGVNKNGYHSLWVTNGTLAGTDELTDIPNANSVNFNPSNMSVLISGSSPSPTPTAPSLTDYIRASAAAYGLDTGNFTPPSGMTLLEESPQAQASDGFEAAALRDTYNNIIIANEGSLPVKGLLPIIRTPYSRNSDLANFAVVNDQTPKALTDAITFAEKIQQAYGGKIYVTGHSLGGIEAEAEAKALQVNFAEGATFGAAGLPGNTTAGGPVGLTNYVDYGDPVGNYASDSNCALHNHTAGLMYHYGTVDMVGDSANAVFILNAVATREVSLALPPGLRDAATYDDHGTFAIVSNLLIATQYHGISNYAKDLFISLTPGEKIVPAISFDEFLMTYDDPLGNAGLKNTERATVQNNGTLVSPDMTLSENATDSQITIDETSNIQESWGTVRAGGVTTISLDQQTGLITKETYVSPDSSVYNATLNSSETVTVVQVNTNTGGSYRITYDTANSQPWSSFINFYAGKNETGVLTETIYNWHAGGSQVQLFTGLPQGVHEEIKNYSGPNGTGKLLSTQFK